MSFPSILEKLSPVLFLIVAGNVLATVLGLPSAALTRLTRYLMFPIVLFFTLDSRVGARNFALFALVGAAMAAMGIMAARNARRVVTTKVDEPSTLPDLANFTIPFLVFAWKGKGVDVACALFVGVAVVNTVMGRRVAGIVREPWVWAAIIAIAFEAMDLSTRHIERAVGPLREAAYPMMLLTFGASLDFRGAFKASGAWMTVLVRMVSGAAAATLAILLLRYTGVTAEIVFLSSIAPPATRASFFSEGGKSDAAAASLGAIVTLILIATLLNTGWEPWDLA